MKFQVNPLLSNVGAPPIAEAVGWIDGRTFPADKPLIDVSQAVPGYPPPRTLTDYLASVVHDPITARYTDIEGIPPLRQALATDLNRVYGGKVAAENVMITAGCNQAYCLATQSLAKPGEEILLPIPYYFNYQMWPDMAGIVAVHLTARLEVGGAPDLAEAERSITPKTRAMVLISPNNPTGHVYLPATIRACYEFCKRRGIALILDETYRDFMPHDQPPHDLFLDADWADTLIHLYSFSKVFCLTGYRVGALVGHPKLVGEIAKAMDCLAICAPRIGQMAALHGLQHLGVWRAGNTRLMRDRLMALTSAFARNDLGYEVISAGAFFAYVKHPHRGLSAMEVGRRLADRQNILALPGSMFGPGQDTTLRLAFANVDAKWMPELAARLAKDAAEKA